MFSIFFVLNAAALPAASLNKDEENTPEDFVRMIYQYFAEENFEGVYNNFLPVLKKKLMREDYISFQQKNFQKYNLKYSNITVGDAEKIDYQDLPEDLQFEDQADYYYKIEVSYQLNFEHLGQNREEQSEKNVFLAEKRYLKTGDINRFYLIWNPEPMEENDRDDSDE
ncbi:MAG: hypothetical protein ACQESS_05410 [Bacillota bacterium]